MTLIIVNVSVFGWFMAYTFRNLLGLLESAIMLRTSMHEINVQQPNFFNRAIDIINFEKPFLNFITDTMNSFPNLIFLALLREGLSEPEFYGELVYKFKKLIGTNDFSFQFRKIITRYRRIGYNLNVMRQSSCLVFNPITVDNYAAFFNCTPVGRASDSMMAPT